MPGNAPAATHAARSRASTRASEVTQAHGGTRPVSVEGARHRVEAALADGYAVVLACEPSLEGTLGATGIGYFAHADEQHIRLAPRNSCQARFGELVVEAPHDADEAMVALARRVYLGIERHVSAGCPRARDGRCPARCTGACTRRLMYAAAADDPYVPEAVHRYARLAFAQGGRLRSLIAEGQVVKVDELARAVLDECERTRQSARFSLLEDGSLFSVFSPKADTIPLTASYFAQRMADERFCIVDPVHRSAAFYDPGKLGGRKARMVVRLDLQSAGELARAGQLSLNEPYVHALWMRFYDMLAPSGRNNAQRAGDSDAFWVPRRFLGWLAEADPCSCGTGVTSAARPGGAGKGAA